MNGTKTTYLVDSNRPYAQVLEEYEDENLKVRYVQGLDLISVERDGEVSVYLVDGLGSTRVLTDLDGEVVATYTYDAFGELLDSTGEVENDYLFAGEQFDGELDQYYLRQRFYDAGMGRFTRRDTYEGRIGEPVTLHKYLYAHNNPSVYTDPTGLFVSSESQTVALTIQDILLSIAVVAMTVVETEKPCPYTIDEEHLFYPDTRIRPGSISGFHSTARALEGIDYNWASPDEVGIEADFEPFNAEFTIPSKEYLGSKRSSFFPINMRDSEVLEKIGEAYIKAGCPPTGDWSAVVENDLTFQDMLVTGTAFNYHVLTSYPSF